jgi:hypothetical protein
VTLAEIQSVLILEDLAGASGSLISRRCNQGSLRPEFLGFNEYPAEQ